MTHSPAYHDRYFNWLYDMLFAVRDPESRDSYTTICRLMFHQEFKTLVPYDDNRVAEAMETRAEFQKVDETAGPELVDSLMNPVSIFEVLIALAAKAEFNIPLSLQAWFMIFITNLGLKKYNDQYCLIHTLWPIERAVNKFNNRQYRPDGKGGIFPLRDPQHDQRHMELWYQWAAYAQEHEMY